jgi:hypothetical protein
MNPGMIAMLIGLFLCLSGIIYGYGRGYAAGYRAGERDGYVKGAFGPHPRGGGVHD